MPFHHPFISRKPHLAATTRQWEALGNDDPYWAVLTESKSRGTPCDPSPFYQTGAIQIQLCLQELVPIVPTMQRSTALDFGCGVGRLTLGLATHFQLVHGVDASQAMLRVARTNSHHAANVTYFHNVASHLSTFPSNFYDLVYSDRTLQHISARETLAYVAEFVRLVRPRGAIWLQLPAKYLPSLQNYVLRLLPEAILAYYRGFEMHAVRPAIVTTTLKRAGATVVAIEPDLHAGPRWESLHYIATKGLAT